MTRFNIIHILIGSAVAFSAIGCGDASSFSATGEDGSEQIAEDPDPSREADAPLVSELQLACEAFCDVLSECRGTEGVTDCVERCEARHSPRGEDDDACAAAQLDSLNCQSALDCEAAPSDVRRECGAAMLSVTESCESSELVAVEVGDGEGEVVEVGDHTWSDTDSEPEETEASEDDESDESGPIIDVEIPEHPELPEIGPVFDFS